LSQQGVVEAGDGTLAATRGDLHQRGRIGRRLVERHPAEAPPGDGVGHLPAQRFIAEPVAVLEEHHPQVGLDGDRRPADDRVEERPERLEEPLVIEQRVDLRHVAGQAHAALRQDGLPQRELRVYRSQHGGSSVFRKGRLEPS
jgi:hypothetical protein